MYLAMSGAHVCAQQLNYSTCLSTRWWKRTTHERDTVVATHWHILYSTRKICLVVVSMFDEFAPLFEVATRETINNKAKHIISSLLRWLVTGLSFYLLCFLSWLESKQRPYKVNTKTPRVHVVICMIAYIKKVEQLTRTMIADLRMFCRLHISNNL